MKRESPKTCNLRSSTRKNFSAHFLVGSSPSLTRSDIITSCRALLIHINNMKLIRIQCRTDNYSLQWNRQESMSIDITSFLQVSPFFAFSSVFSQNQAFLCYYFEPVNINYHLNSNFSISFMALIPFFSWQKGLYTYVGEIGWKVCN